MDLPRSSSSSSRPLPNPPPQHGYHPAPTGSDPFLQQSRDIALTERDRQEGYDVELLNARPRGSIAGSQRRSEKDDYPVYGAGAAAGAGAGAGAAGLTSKEGYGAGALPGHHQPSSLRQGPKGGRDGRRWWMRPLPLAIILGVVLAVALALGLGVGLSQAHKRSKSNAAENNSVPAGTSATRSGSSSASRTRNATASIFTETGSTTAGVVIPSSLYSSFVSAFSGSSDAPFTLATSSLPVSSSSVERTDRGAGAATTDPNTITSLPTNTYRASTGNLPIPATAETTLGTEVISVISALGGTDRLRLRRAPRPTAAPVLG